MTWILVVVFMGLDGLGGTWLMTSATVGEFGSDAACQTAGRSVVAEWRKSDPPRRPRAWFVCTPKERP